MKLTPLIYEIIDNLKLGIVVNPPTKLTGGLMHSMYKVETSKDTFVIKLLNRNIMKRDDALNNFLNADNLESIIEDNHIPIIPALLFNNTKLQKIRNQYFYVFKWYAGKSLKSDEIHSMHIQKISEILSKIHQIKQKNEPCFHNQININFDYYIDEFKKRNVPIYDLLITNKQILIEMQDQNNQAIPKIPPLICICHNDMDSKNILWLKDDFKIIDLECLNYASPYLELLELALSYSGYEQCHLNFELFDLFIKTYFKHSTKPSIDWKVICDSTFSRLEWLEYNLKRGLMIECESLVEQQLGAMQVIETLKLLIYYYEIKDQVLNYLS